jgi:hypothetical protein
VSFDVHDEHAWLKSRQLGRRSMLKGLSAGTVALAAGATISPRLSKAQESTAVSEVDSNSWEAVTSEMEAIGESTWLLAAELVDGDCQTIHAVRADEISPVGSGFKLFILGELARQVEEGLIDWEETIAIRDDYKGPLHGDLYYAPEGENHTVRYLAERMIQKSDNTATDHLLFTLGRENVENMMASMGVEDPSVNVPLFSTKEFANLKYLFTTEEIDEYYDSSVEERRQFLEDVVHPIPLSEIFDAPDPDGPTEIDRLEWLFTREDMCRALAYLDGLSNKPDMLPVREILSLETLIPFDGAIWPYAGYKGGSEIGVLSGNWLLRRHDGRTFVLTMGFADSQEELDPQAVLTVMEAARDVLAKSP